VRQNQKIDVEDTAIRCSM